MKRATKSKYEKALAGVEMVEYIPSSRLKAERIDRAYNHIRKLREEGKEIACNVVTGRKGDIAITVTQL